MLAATCLALNVYFEARSEPVSAQFAVAQVTMNRVLSDKYPDTVCGIVWQRKQFSWTHDGKSDRPPEEQAWRRAKWVAAVTLNDVDNSVDILPRSALHYHADYVKPYWVSSLVKVAQIGRHIFYRRKT